jgi:hypothetical protein
MLHMAGKSYLPVEAFLHQFADRSHRRLISAAKLLAAVHRLEAPQVLCVRAVKVELPPGSALLNGSPALPELPRGQEGSHS